MRLPHLLTLAACALAAGCGSSATDTSSTTQTVARVTILGPTATVQAGELTQLTAVASDASGVQIASPGVFTWASSAPSVATVSQAGRVISVAAGQVMITAAVAGVTGSYAMTVTSAATATKDTISLLATTFSPAAITVSQGASVTFLWGGSGDSHNVIFRTTTNSPGSPQDIQNTTKGSFVRTFSAKGSFTFDCTIHTGMTGVVTVQ